MGWAQGCSGVVTVGYEHHAHTLEHHGNAARVEDADPVAREGCRQIHAWYTQFFAEMTARMREIDEGGSSLLDNTILLYTSYMSDGGHGRSNYPVLLAGGGGGTLPAGISLSKDTPVANIRRSRRLGDRRGEFGSRTSPNATTPPPTSAIGVRRSSRRRDRRQSLPSPESSCMADSETTRDDVVQAPPS